MTFLLIQGRDQCATSYFGFGVLSTLLAVAAYLYTRRYTQDQMIADKSQELIRDQPLRLPCQETQTGPSKMVSGR